jgi:hypothetical protein
MWAIIENNVVIGCIPPDIDINKTEVQNELNGRFLVKMTLENSPAGINWTYKNDKFSPPDENFFNGGKGEN